MKRIRLLPFGGPLLKNSNAKTARSLCATSWTHVVLHARSFDFKDLNSFRRAKNLLEKAAKKSGVKLENVTTEGRQLHFLVQLRRKRNFAPFIRAATGSLALCLSNGSKNNPLKKAFWACRPWTCVIQKLKALFGPQSLNHFILNFELAELLRARYVQGLVTLGP